MEQITPYSNGRAQQVKDEGRGEPAVAATHSYSAVCDFSKLDQLKQSLDKNGEDITESVNLSRHMVDTLRMIDQNPSQASQISKVASNLKTMEAYVKYGGTWIASDI